MSMKNHENDPVNGGPEMTAAEMEAQGCGDCPDCIETPWLELIQDDRWELTALGRQHQGPRAQRDELKVA